MVDTMERPAVSTQQAPTRDRVQGKISLVLPAHNEEPNIRTVVEEAKQVLPTAFTDYIERPKLQSNLKLFLFVDDSSGAEVENRWVRLDMIEVLQHLAAVEAVPCLVVVALQREEGSLYRRVSLGNHAGNRTCAHPVMGGDSPNSAPTSGSRA